MKLQNNKMKGVALVAVTVAVASGALLAPQTAHAQERRVRGGRQAIVSPLMNSNVLVFAPVITSGDGSVVKELTKNQRDVQDIVGDAIRRQMVKGGLGTFLYSRRLPSIQRAINEGYKAEMAATGPGDNPAEARRLADLAGASEFVNVTIDDYKYDATNKTATFNVSLTRTATVDGVSLGASAEKAVGVATAGVIGPRQEGSAAANAADVVAEQVVVALYPETKVVEEPKKGKRGKPAPVKQTTQPVTNPVDKPAGAPVSPPAPVSTRPNSAPVTSATPTSPQNPKPPTNPKPKPGQPATAPRIPDPSQPATPPANPTPPVDPATNTLPTPPVVPPVIPPSA